MADDIRHQQDLAPTDAEQDVFYEYVKQTGGPGVDPEIYVQLVIDGVVQWRAIARPGLPRSFFLPGDLDNDFFKQYAHLNA